MPILFDCSVHRSLSFSRSPRLALSLSLSLCMAAHIRRWSIYAARISQNKTIKFYGRDEPPFRSGLDEALGDAIESCEWGAVRSGPVDWPLRRSPDTAGHWQILLGTTGYHWVLLSISLVLLDSI